MEVRTRQGCFFQKKTIDNRICMSLPASLTRVTPGSLYTLEELFFARGFSSRTVFNLLFLQWNPLYLTPVRLANSFLGKCRKTEKTFRHYVTSAKVENFMRLEHSSYWRKCGLLSWVNIFITVSLSQKKEVHACRVLVRTDSMIDEHNCFHFCCSIQVEVTSGCPFDVIRVEWENIISQWENIISFSLNNHKRI